MFWLAILVTILSCTLLTVLVLLSQVHSQWAMPVCRQVYRSPLVGGAGGMACTVQVQATAAADGQG